MVLSGGLRIMYVCLKNVVLFKYFSKQDLHIDLDISIERGEVQAFNG